MKFVVPSIIIVILIALLTAWLTFLTTKGSLTDDRNRKNLWTNLTLRGKKVFFVLLGITSLLVFQEWNNWNIKNNNDYQLRNEQNNRDSLITKGIKDGVDSSSSSLFNKLSQAFALQNLKIDTINDRFDIFKDSLKLPIINSVKGEYPILFLDTVGITIDKLGKEYTISVQSLNAGSTNFNIRMTLLFWNSDNTYDFYDIDNMAYDSKIPENWTYSTNVYLNWKGFSGRVYLNLKGTYTNLDGTIKMNINDWYGYNTKHPKTYAVAGWHQNILNEVLSDYSKEDIILLSRRKAIKSILDAHTPVK